MVKLILLTILFFIYDNGLFRLSERHECKKAKGNCNNCKAWSCKKNEIEWNKKNGR